MKVLTSPAWISPSMEAWRKSDPWHHTRSEKYYELCNHRLRRDRPDPGQGICPARYRRIRGNYARAGELCIRRGRDRRSEEHTSELQSLMRLSYAVFCLTQKNPRRRTRHTSYDRG